MAITFVNQSPIKMFTGELPEYIVAPNHIRDTTKIGLACPICGNPQIEFTDPAAAENHIDNLVILEIGLPMICSMGHKGTIVFISVSDETGKKWTNCTFRKSIDDYSEYLQSDDWKKKSEDAKDRAGRRCQLCNKKGKNGTLHAHHRTYERIGHELPEDITVLCPTCHAKFHGKDVN